MHSDAESLKEAYPLYLVYHDAEAGLDGVNHRRTPNEAAKLTEVVFMIGSGRR